MTRGFSTLAVVILSMLVGAGILAGLTLAFDNDGPDGNEPAAASTSGDTDDETSGSGTGSPAALDYTELYQRVRPSVVRVTTGDVDADAFLPDVEGLGSGVVVDEDGHILTNHHVIAGFDEVTVTFADGTQAPAEVVGRDPGNDIALIRVDVSGDLLFPATLGDSGSVEIGTVVAAVGNPFGLDGSFTTGVVSGLDRSLSSVANGRQIRGLIQTDAAVNVGNSGGALFNMQGEVIGINTAIENPAGRAFAGVAYAVAIDTAKRFMPQLVAGETIDHPRLGISGRTLTPAQAEDLGVPHGVAILDVDAGSGADRAGLLGATDGSGDIIVAIDGVPMQTFEDLADHIDSKDVGDEVTLSVNRDGEEIELQATLRSWDSSA
jgi:S1-C subfamily serine protease